MQPAPTVDDLLLLIHRLPPAQQAQLFARLSAEIASLVQQMTQTPPPSRSLQGLWEHDHPPISAEDIAAARQDMWGDFPRDDI
jgi:uncharacterized protein YhdP